jgi:2-polyprenyl-3-methyl-5-hydroxy-6-metoxy-1,4-benzoquinol methylase
MIAGINTTLFRETNPTIDYETLGGRVSLELARMRRAEKGQWGFAAVGVNAELSDDPGKRRADFPLGETMLLQRTIRKLSDWMWCFYHLPAMWRTASTAQAQAAAAIAEVTTAKAETRSEVDAAKAELAARKAEAGEAKEALEILRTHYIDLSNQIGALRREIMFQQRRLSRLAERQSNGLEEGGLQRAASSNARLDAFYLAFEDVFRGSREDIKLRVAQHLERLVLAGAGQSSKPILDAGCGRGEWLEILKEAGLAAYGVDSNSMMVERAASLGLSVIHGDVLEHLRSLENESRSAVTAFHVVEHLPFSTLIDFLDEALRVLTPGGLLLLETPNPENMRVGATTFYSDPTHINPIPPETLRFIVQHRGFTETEIVRLNPDPPRLQLHGNDRDLQFLNALLFGPRDYSIVARRI